VGEFIFSFMKISNHFTVTMDAVLCLSEVWTWSTLLVSYLSQYLQNLLLYSPYFVERKLTVAFRYTTGELTGRKYRAAEGHFVRGFITKYYGVEPEIVIYVCVVFYRYALSVRAWIFECYPSFDSCRYVKSYRFSIFRNPSFICTRTKIWCNIIDVTST
jgi:hypothetical protein